MARLEELLFDLTRKVENLEKKAQDEFLELNKEIRSVRRTTKKGIRKGQRDRPPLPPLPVRLITPGN